MKRLLIVSLAVVGLAACSSNPYKPAAVEPRKPSSSTSDSLANVSDAAIGLAGETIIASVNVSKVSKNASEDIATSDNGILGPFSTSVNASKDVAIIGWGVSKKASAVVVVAAIETSKLVKASVNQVITTSGEILTASVNDSKTAIGVSVEFSQDAIRESKDLIVKVGKFTLGTVKLSATTASKVADWTSDKVSDAVDWSVDSSGRLYHGSKDVVGDVLDTSGEVVQFVLEGSNNAAIASGKILTVASDVSVAVVKGSGNLISDLAKDSASASKKAGHFLVGKVVSSAQKSVVYVKWSGRQSSRASKFVFTSIPNLLHATPEDRPDSSVTAPGSSAAAPGSSSSQPN